MIGLLAITACVGISAPASGPIATITSAESFRLDGHPVSTPGVASLPLAVGDEVATENAPALIVFPDGSSVKLAADSSARLIGSDKHPKLILMAGALDYKLILGSNVSVTNLDIERKPAEPSFAQPGSALKPLRTPRSDEVTPATSSR